MSIKNRAKIKDDEINELRSALEHRAAWFYLLVDEADKMNVDREELARKAVFRCGEWHGDKNFGSARNLTDFARLFPPEKARKIFEMETTLEKNIYTIKFNYCPLVKAWQELTDDEEEIARLCDWAMEGDRGIISRFDFLQMNLKKTIARGDDCCILEIKEIEK